MLIFSRFSSKFDLGSIEDQRYTCVHFMDDKVIAGTDAGEIVLFAMKVFFRCSSDFEVISVLTRRMVLKTH
jgi:hypothetical protein